MNDVAVLDHSQTAMDIRAQVNRIQEVMKEVMQKGTHYGVVPGCGDKPTLLKAGAEKLMMTFRLAVDPEIEDLSDSCVRRYRVKTRVTAQIDGTYLGSCVGECSSDEEKYSWREAVCKEEFEATDPSLRREKWKRNLKAPLLQVHTNPADVANTILKMAKKRSLVDAVLTVTGASDIFTQDIEDIPEEILNRGTSVKGESSTEWHVPNYGPDAGQPFSAVKIDHLKDYLDGMERSIKDPKKANFLQKNEAMRDALKDEIAKRELPVPAEKAGATADPTAGAKAAEDIPITQRDHTDDDPAEPYRVKLRVCERTSQAITHTFNTIPEEIRQDCFSEYQTQLKALSKKK